MRKRLENVKKELESQGKLQGHLDVILAFEHLLNEVDTHEEERQVENAKLAIHGVSTDGHLQAALAAEDVWFRQAAYSVIERTAKDLIERGNKSWTKFFEQVE